MIYLHCEDTAIGYVGVAADGDHIIKLSLPNEPLEIAGAAYGQTPLLRLTFTQLHEYFAGQRRVFELPIAPAGTAFMCAVWGALVAIPYGETRTYAEIAAVIGSPRACRAVGQANHRNPIPIIIPCHRVVGAGGTLVGYGGGLELKQRLLALEQCNALL